MSISIKRRLSLPQSHAYYALSTATSSAFLIRAFSLNLMLIASKRHYFINAKIATMFALSLAFTITNAWADQQASISPHKFFLLNDAIALAHERDPWLTSSKFKERAIMAQSEASLALPDPVVSLSIANVPTNGFRLNQEPMTQLKAGVSQMLPRGNSRQIQSQYQQELALEQPFLRAQRIAESSVQVSALWLEVYKAQAKITLIEENQILLSQLGDIAKKNYAWGIGSTRQQDVVNASLEVNKIEDRLIQARAQKTASIQRLNEWLQIDATQFSSFTLPNTLVPLEPIPAVTQFALNSNNRQTLANMLNQHPVIQAIEQRVSASASAIALAKQKYYPQWGLNASYAYRDDDQLGASRADFLSIGISFDVPLYTSQKQDNEVSARVYASESIKTDKRLALRQLMSQLTASYTLYQHLQARMDLYETQILPQTLEKVQIVVSAFTNNDGDFDDVLNAQITQLNAKLSLLDIQVELHKTHSQLSYYMTSTSQKGL
ncbi:TolC family protein [Glaciecola punicea]|uniref:TolC family protein n=1 Tax=Glaciecola punicea TaxID=56804 RepID=UPI0009F5869C|nr:TolC family protein [Glaciecola punicea]